MAYVNCGERCKDGKVGDCHKFSWHPSTYGQVMFQCVKFLVKNSQSLLGWLYSFIIKQWNLKQANTRLEQSVLKKTFIWTHANLSNHSEEFKVEEQNLVNTCHDSRIWRCQVRVRRQVGNDCVWICDVETIIVKSRHLVQRIYSEKLLRSVFVLIEIHIF